MRPWAYLLALTATLPGAGCARLHTVQIGDIDDSLPREKPVEVKQSETGLDVGEAARLANFASGGRASGAASGVEKLWKALTYGPKTGNVVFADDYADQVLEKLQERCPGGRLTGFMTIRETNKYPVVSGEIVRVRAYCSPLEATPPAPLPPATPAAGPASR